MKENVNQPELYDTNVSNALPSISGSLSNQHSVPSADAPNEGSPYEDSPVPYLPLPSKSIPQTSPPSGAALRGVDTTSSSSLPANTAARSPRIGGAGVLVGVILGAILGGVVSYISGGGLVTWASIGAVVGGVIACLPYVLSEGDVPLLVVEGLFEGLGGLFNCCSISAILMIGSVVTISGLLLWQNWLLAALAGGSILTMMLVGGFFALLKHFFAKGRVYRQPLSRQVFPS